MTRILDPYLVASNPRNLWCGRMAKMSFLIARYGGSTKMYMLGLTDTDISKSQDGGQIMNQSETDFGLQSAFTFPRKIDSDCN